MSRGFVTASVARQSMHLKVMDCFTSFAMTEMVHRENPLRHREATPRHREAEGRGDPCRNTSRHGLPRRFAPRSDETLNQGPFAVPTTRNRV